MPNLNAVVTVISGAEIYTPHHIFPTGRLVMADGHIAALGDLSEVPVPGDARELDAEGLIIAPGFIDTHIHGGAGYDFMDDDPEALPTISRHVARYGTTSFVATTMAAPPEETRRVLRVIQAAMTTDLGGAAALGVHLASPYLSPERKGAQPERHFRKPDLDQCRRLLQGYMDTVRICTLAPELPGALEIVSWLNKRGIVASLGHSDATYEQAEAAVEAGLTRATHFFNAMRALSHRDPGAAGALLTDTRVHLELIADMHHVHPAALQLAINTKGSAGIVLVSDAMRATGLPDGEYELGGQTVRTKEGEARLGDGTLAGSLLTLDVAIRNLISWVGMTLQQALTMATATPARFLRMRGRKGTLEPGADADLVLLNRNFQVIATFVAGIEVYRKA